MQLSITPANVLFKKIKLIYSELHWDEAHLGVCVGAVTFYPKNESPVESRMEGHRLLP